MGTTRKPWPWWYKSLIAATLFWLTLGGGYMVFFDPPRSTPHYVTSLIAVATYAFSVLVALKAFDPDRTKDGGR